MRKLCVLLVVLMLSVVSCKERTTDPMVIINDFNNSGLECINTTMVEKDDSYLPNVFEIGYRCEITKANNQGLRVFYFSNPQDQDLVFNYYTNLPHMGGNASHLYKSGDLLFQTEKKNIQYDLLINYLQIFEKYK